MDLFDIIGPVMVGPSSSHTAGAARIGKIARMLLGSRPVRARIGLYGSFQKTYLGHGTDKALIGGLLGMGVDDSRLRDSLRLAAEAKLEYSFYNADVRGAHPNTVILDVDGDDGRHILRAGLVRGRGRDRGQRHRRAGGGLLRPRKHAGHHPPRYARHDRPHQRRAGRGQLSTLPPCGCFAARWAATPWWRWSWTARRTRR